MGFVPTGHRPIKSRHFYQAGDNYLDTTCELVFYVVFCRWLYVSLSFVFWPLYFLIFNLQLLITSLESSKCSCINLSIIKPVNFQQVVRMINICRHHDVVDRYEIWKWIFSFLCRYCHILLSLPRLLQDLVVYMSNTTGVL